MTLRGLLFTDASLSVFLHVFKAFTALAVNWIVLHQFGVQDFVTWSVTSSILIVATASDLGIGQYLTTQMINSPRSEWPGHISRGLSSLIPLALASALFAFVALDGPSPLYRAAMAILLAGRLVAIPFIAVLHARNQFKIRKAIELVAYIVAALLVTGIAWIDADVHLALLALNGTFLLGAALMVVASARYCKLAGSLALSSSGIWHLLRNTMPFMVNNLTGLLTYGGFIWLSSLVLPKTDIAKLAVLYSFVLVNMYQVYDVFLKARQAALAEPAHIAPMLRLNFLLMIAVPVAFVIAGREALSLIGNPVSIDLAETALFGVFIALELGNLFTQSIAQVNLALVPRLKTYSALRAAMLSAFVIAAFAPAQANEAKLILLLGFLSLGSLVTFAYLLREIRRQGGMPRGHADKKSDFPVAR